MIRRGFGRTSRTLRRLHSARTVYLLTLSLLSAFEEIASALLGKRRNERRQTHGVMLQTQAFKAVEQEKTEETETIKVR